ncbi:MAG: pentapeptide repeat-containing protein [Bacteroidales bacterium]|nr:pentapeptide repeat-containing protein [Bacteroidales bacterium]
MTREELDKIVEQHQHWIHEDCEGWTDMRANLHGVDLHEANLHGVNLSGANLYGANLSGADLSWVDLHGANMHGVNLSGANLYGANLSGANLYGADLSGADLHGVNLYGANLSRADQYRLGNVLYEPLTGYKKTNEGVVITAEIPAGAIVFCINGIKCRTNRAKITDMGGHEVLHSQYDNYFEYRLGQEINIKDFNLMYNVECESGFHFFRTRKEAEEYK